MTTDPHFGEQGGKLTYGTYLRVAELLDQQVPESDPAAHDELLFITIHQVYELWFQQLLHELTDARDRMLAGETYLPRVRLERCHVIERVLVGQVDVIDSMTPLKPGSTGDSMPASSHIDVVGHSVSHDPDVRNIRNPSSADMMTSHPSAR